MTSLTLFAQALGILTGVFLTILGISKNRKITIRVLIAIALIGLAFWLKDLFFLSPFDRYMSEASQGYNYRTVWATEPSPKALLKLDKALAVWVPSDGLENKLRALCWRGNLLNLVGKNDEAVSNYGQAIQIDSKEFRIYVARANAFSELDKRDAAMLDYEKALELTGFPQTLKYIHSKHDFLGADYANNIYFYRGLYCFKSKDFRNAIQDFTRVIEADGKVGVYYRLRGKAYNRSQKYKEAIEDFTKSMTLPCSDAAALRERGYAYLQTKQNEKAVDDFTKANFKENYPPFRWFNFYERALAYRNLGQIDKANQDDLQAQNLHLWVSGKNGMQDLPPN